MQRAYFFLFIILLAQCKTSPDKQAGTATADSTSKPRRAYDYCYTNKSGIFVFTAGDRIGRHLKLEANDVRLSPDGTWLAYTYSDSSFPERRVGLMDLETEKTTILDSGCYNCYGPVWSPDGKYLAYNAYADRQWRIKYVDRENTHAEFLIKKVDGHEYYSPQWAPDSRSIVVQDMAAVRIIDLGGNTLKTIPFSDIDTNIAVSSAISFLLTPKEEKLIYESGVSTDTIPAPNSDEPPSYIFSYDMNSKKVTRLTAAKYNCFKPVLRGDTIFCHGWDPAGEPHDMGNVYRMNINGGDFKLAFKSCNYFSCRR